MAHRGAEDVSFHQTGWQQGLMTTLSSVVVLVGSFPWRMACDHQPNLKQLVLDF